MRIKNLSNEAFKDVEFVFDVDGSSLDEVLQNVLDLLQKHEKLTKDTQAELDIQLQQSNLIDAVENGVAVIHHHSPNIKNVEVIIRTGQELSSITGKDGLPFGLFGCFLAPKRRINILHKLRSFQIYSLRKQ